MALMSTCWKTCKECELLSEGNFCGHKQKWKVHYTRGYQPCPRMIPNSTHHNHCIIIQHNPTTSCQRSLPKKNLQQPSEPSCDVKNSSVKIQKCCDGYSILGSISILSLWVLCAVTKDRFITWNQCLTGPAISRDKLFHSFPGLDICYVRIPIS